MSKAIGPNLVFKHMPGALELLEQGSLDDDVPQFENINSSSTTRGWPTDLTASEIKNRWRSLLRRLKGYQKDKVLIQDEAVWIPIFKLYVPPLGKSSLSYQAKVGQNISPELKILGFGFGSTGSVSFTETIKIPAEKRGKLVEAKLLATVTRYINSSNNQKLYRLDLKNLDGHIEQRITDLPLQDPIAEAKKLTSTEWRVLREYRLSAKDVGQFNLRYELEQRSTWKTDLKFAPLSALGIETGVSLELENSNQFELNFDMPYGHDYVFYCRNDESPLVPMCTIRT
jgi:hypothetical protein